MNVNPITRLDYPDPDVIRVEDTYYMVSELSCQIFVFEYQPDCKDMLRNVQVISTRREDGYDRENYTSALQMHPSGRYLLAGNRGHNSIVVYEVDKETGLLMLKGHTMLAGDFCREFCFVPDGSMLIVGIQHTDVVQTFFFDENKGILKWSGQEIVIPSPSYYNIFMVNIPYSQ